MVAVLCVIAYEYGQIRTTDIVRVLGEALWCAVSVAECAHVLGVFCWYWDRDWSVTASSLSSTRPYQELPQGIPEASCDEYHICGVAFSIVFWYIDTTEGNTFSRKGPNGIYSLRTFCLVCSVGCVQLRDNPSLPEQVVKLLNFFVVKQATESLIPSLCSSSAV